MIKKLLLSSLATAGIAGSALAADLPARMAPPPPAPVPVFTWTGAYVGINGGGLFRNNDQSRVFAVPGPCASAGAGCVGAAGIAPLATGRALANAINAAGNGFNNGSNRGGFLGGGQIGINYQVSPSFVFGGELDGQGVWTSNNNTNANVGVGTAPVIGFPRATSTAIVSFNHRLDYLVTARARVGFLATPAFLIYGTGGAAFGGARTTVSLAAAPAGDRSVVGGAPVFANGDRARAGWTAGGGLEWMFLPNWSVKAEALYYDLGRFQTTPAPLTVVGATSGVVVGSALTVASFRERGIIARGGLNYHFGWTDSAPVVARY